MKFCPSQGDQRDAEGKNAHVQLGGTGKRLNRAAQGICRRMLAKGAARMVDMSKTAWEVEVFSIYPL